MNKKSPFLYFLEKIPSNNKFLIESIKNGYRAMFETSTEEQVQQIKTKLSINTSVPVKNREESLDTLVPPEKDDTLSDEVEKLDELY
jgi:hypothetical protein